MGLDSLPVFASLRSALSFHSQRAQTLAVNVANAETPGFTPRDIAGGDVGRALASRNTPNNAVTLARTSALHLAPRTAAAASFAVAESPDSETTLDGNSVVLEEQMARVAETRMAYEASISLYQKTLGLLRMAVRAPR